METETRSIVDIIRGIDKRALRNPRIKQKKKERIQRICF